jgi:hypothetical protein
MNIYNLYCSINIMKNALGFAKTELTIFNKKIMIIHEVRLTMPETQKLTHCL